MSSESREPASSQSESQSPPRVPDPSQRPAAPPATGTPQPAPRLTAPLRPVGGQGPGASARGCFGPATILLIILLMMVSAPRLGEQIAYHWSRGHARAEAEVNRELLAELPAAENRFPAVAKAVAPSVVGIETTLGEQPDDELSFLWPHPRSEEKGEGSGVIIDDAGHILTNFHVINGAEKMVVQLNDGRLVEDVRLVGIDQYTDLAVLQIDEPELTPLAWGDSDALAVGDWVVAIGSPYGLRRTVTAGIISAKDRRASFGDGPRYQDFLQSDAAINPGNSGGPLVNLRGELVGINTAIFGESFQGIGFAIPSNLAKKVAEKVMANHDVSLGWLGVEMQELTRSDAKALGIPQARGALIVKLMPNSPAVDAGIRPGDVVVEWDGDPIRSAIDLSYAVIRTAPDSTVDVLLYREGQKRKASVTVGRRPGFEQKQPM